MTQDATEDRGTECRSLETTETPLVSGTARRDQCRQIAYMLLLLDALGACTACMLAFMLFPDALSSHPRLSQAMVPLYIALVTTVQGRMGLYATSGLYYPRPLHWRPLVAHLAAMAVIYAATLIVSRHGVHVPFLAVVGTLGGAFGAASRLLIRRLEGPDTFRLRTLVLGTGDFASFLCDGLSKTDQVEVLGAVSVAHEDTPNELPVPVLGDAEDLVKLIHERDADTIVIATSERLNDSIYAVLGLCAESGVKVERMAEFYEKWLRMVPVAYVTSGWSVHGFGHQVEPYYDILHRFFDVLAAGVGLVTLGLAYPFVAVAIRLTSPGPVLYCPSDPRFYRVGMGGRQFRIYKFRTMRTDLKVDISYTAENDPRITPIGRLLRKTKIDELPQFWNVLVGQMSIVGPRPLSACEDEEMLKSVPLQNLRRVIRPGLTGLGQVCYGTANTPDEHLVRLQSDLYYIKYRSLSLDVWILAQTLLVCAGLRKRDE